ncbi:MAG: hypothetical protein AMJ73_04510 [candidate division Zixibacteria bacterium SM1_73]|nr:MAG: hypothetical protein AMJ73_04510 [candidate division Zixibacteria bacterium SM1_73]
MKNERKVWKVLEVDNNLLETCDVSHLIRLFFKEMKKKGARLLCGKVILTFPKYDGDKRPNCIIPEIRNFVRQLHKEEARFPFYYVDEKSVGMHLQHIACLSPLADIELTENGIKFGVKLSNPTIIEDYLSNVSVFMQQLNYTEPEISERINSIAISLGVQF